jgi:ribosomal protein S18 acetylase RimI-like enzyme
LARLNLVAQVAAAVRLVRMEPDKFARWDPGRRRSPVDCQIRPGTEKDVDACADLAVQIGAGDAAKWRDTFIRTVRDGVERVLFVAEVDGAVVGYGRAAFFRAAADGPSASSGWYLLGVAVAPEWRRRGIGEGLTRERIRWVAERSDRIYYFTHRDNRTSQALHDQFGFEELALPVDWAPPGGTSAEALGQKLYAAHPPVL